MNGDNPSPNRPLVTVVYKWPDFYDGEKKPPVNRR
ncbi:protein MgtT [Escherichia coli]